MPLSATHDIPSIGFGTYLIEPEEAQEAVSTAISIGYRHIDTAAAYENEAEVGEGVRKALSDQGLKREDIFITTKFAPGWLGDPPKDTSATLADAQDSLEKLDLGYIDLYLIHAPFGGPERLNQWRALVELQQSGRCRNIGVSNYNQDHLEEIREAGLPMPDANQLELHPWSQKPELIAYMRQSGILPIAYSSLLPLANWRHKVGEDSAKTAQMQADASEFEPLAAKYGVSEAQFLLKWGLQSGFAILPKSLNPERMRQNLDLDGFTIDKADMARITQMDRGAGVAWSAGDPLQMEYD